MTLKKLLMEMINYESIGGLNVLYGHRPKVGLRGRYYSDGAFVWIADSPEFLQKLGEDNLIARTIEQKSLQTILEKSIKKPVILFPGFASTQLISWKKKKCFGTSIQVNFSFFSITFNFGFILID